MEKRLVACTPRLEREEEFSTKSSRKLQNRQQRDGTRRGNAGQSKPAMKSPAGNSQLRNSESRRRLTSFLLLHYRDGQARRSTGTKRMLRLAVWLGELRSEKCVRILIDLLRCLKILFVAPIILKLTFRGGVISTDLRPSLINTAPMIGLQMLTGRVNQQIPILSLDKNRGSIVQ